MPDPAEPREPATVPTLVAVSSAKDFSISSFQVTISRIQQLALEKANHKVPCPEEQLALIRAKKGKPERMKLGKIFDCLLTHFDRHSL